MSTQALIGDEHDRSKDWKEAFAQHPDVGAEVAALARQAPGQRDSLEVERAGLAGASEETVQELARLHGEYVDKFGFAFLTCTARGKSADQMLAALKARLPNDPALELKVAAAEQARTAYYLMCAWAMHGALIAAFVQCVMRYAILQAKITYLRLEKLELPAGRIRARS